MTTPVVVLTDHLLATTGDLVIEVGHGSHFECVSASTLGGGDWVRAKIEWSIDDAGSDYATGLRGFNFSHYHRTEGTFTVTCTVTNLNGEVGVGQRTVVVGASTRTVVTVNEGDDLYAVYSANSGSDKEFVLTGNVTCSDTILRAGNTLFRSSVDGTKRTIAWTGSSPNLGVVLSTQNVTQNSVRDMNFTLGGANLSGFVVSSAGTNNCIINCDVFSVSYDQMLNCSSNPRGVLIQDCNTFHDDSGQNIWGGNNNASRMMCVYGGSHLSTENNDERSFRGHGKYFSFHNTSFLRTSDVKEPMSWAEIDYSYAFKTTVLNQSPGGSAGPLLVGHTSNVLPNNHIVFDRCLIGVTERVNGTLRLGPNTSTAEDLVFRNCVFLNIEFRLAHLTTCRWYHNTHVNTICTGRWIRSEGELYSDLTAYGNLIIQPNTLDYSMTFFSNTDMADEITEWSNNITGSAITITDARIVDAINGNKDEDYATFNARANVDGNLRLAVTVDGSYRPTDIDSASLLVTPHADMAIFDEDYYGNPRGATWIIGAVDNEPVDAEETEDLSIWSLSYKQNGTDIAKHTFEWVSNSSGIATVSSGMAVSGQIERVVFVPSAVAAPTDLYDVTLTDSDGVDVFSGKGADLSGSASSNICPGLPLRDGTTVSVVPTVVDSIVTLNVTNAGDAKAGKVVVYVR